MAASPMTSIYKKLLNGVPADASVAAEGKSSSEFVGYVDTGSYMFNALIGGSLFSGLPDNKILALAGESATGKTFYVIAVIKYWLEKNPKGVVFYFDTESAVTNQMLTERGIPLDRVIKVEPETIEQFRDSAIKILNNYSEIPKDERDPIFFVLDSLGNLSSRKEVADVEAQKDTRDMTKAGAIRGTFRVLRLRLSKLGVPMIVTNHVYVVIGAYVPTKEMSGGMGLKYCADTIVFLSKSKERDKDKQVIGNIIKGTVVKGRLTKENSVAESRILYHGGLDRYHGILDELVDANLITVQSAGRYVFPGSSKTVTTKQILSEPETYFTKELLVKLDEFIGAKFKYTGALEEDDLTENEDEND